MVEHKIAEQFKPNWLRSLIEKGIGFFIQEPLIQHIPARYENAYRAFSQAANVSTDLVLNAVIAPDALSKMASWFFNYSGNSNISQTIGGTSILWDSGSVSILHGRNLDIEDIAGWDNMPLILHVVPNEGMAYVAITTLGIHFTGLTAFNEAGLTLAVHELSLTDTKSNGTPMPVISAEVIRNARSIDDAIAIIKNFPRAGASAYVLSQGHDRAVIEATANEVAIRRSSEAFFFQTNYLLSPALARHRFFSSPGEELRSHQQFAALENEQLINSTRKNVRATPELLINFLQDTTQLPNLTNVQSVVLNASKRRIFVGVEDKPSLAPNNGDYMEYHWPDLRSAARPIQTKIKIHAKPASLESRLLRTLHASSDADSFKKSLNELISFQKNKTEKATWLSTFFSIWHLWSHKLDKPEIEFWLSRLDLAEKEFQLLPTSKAIRHRLDMTQLLRARLLDLSGNRTEALIRYYDLYKHGQAARVRSAANAGLKRAFTTEQAPLPSQIDWAAIDLLQY